VPLDPGQQAVLATIASLTGGGLAGLAGQNALAGSTAAQNEALNNSAGHLPGRASEEELEIDAVKNQLAKQRLAFYGGMATEYDANGNPIPVESPPPPAFGKGSPAGATSTSGATPMISGVTVTDRTTGNVLQGTVDLQPTLDRIASGVKYPTRNDGTTFKNNEGLLPQQPTGYYTEYVVPTFGVNGAGPQRIVTGRGGELYYTPDHYKTFVPVKR